MNSLATTAIANTNNRNGSYCFIFYGNAKVCSMMKDVQGGARYSYEINPEDRKGPF
jgi:hypothetical protein